MPSYTKRNVKRRAKRRAAKIICALLALIIVGVVGYFCKDYIFPSSPTPDPVSGDEVQFHFIDIGQGDAALIRTTAGDILIDAGDNGKEDDLKAYLNSCGVDDLEYVVFTHPDADHIGGSDAVLETYNVKRVLRPNHDAETQTYQRMEELIRAEGAEDIRVKVGDSFKVGEVLLTVLAPIGEKYTGNNNYSIVIRLDYGETSILYTGDAESKSEKEMLERFGNLKNGMLDCDILKVGHHGSDSSSTEDFVRAVSPTVAVISCGENNDYGHPDPEIVERYNDLGIPMVRTDLEGSIVYVSNGGEPERWDP